MPQLNNSKQRTISFLAFITLGCEVGEKPRGKKNAGQGMRDGILDMFKQTGDLIPMGLSRVILAITAQG